MDDTGERDKPRESRSETVSLNPRKMRDFGRGVLRRLELPIQNIRRGLNRVQKLEVAQTAKEGLDRFQETLEKLATAGKVQATLMGPDENGNRNWRFVIIGQTNEKPEPREFESNPEETDIIQSGLRTMVYHDLSLTSGGISILREHHDDEIGGIGYAAGYDLKKVLLTELDPIFTAHTLKVKTGQDDHGLFRTTITPVPPPTT